MAESASVGGPYAVRGGGERGTYATAASYFNARQQARRNAARRNQTAFRFNR